MRKFYDPGELAPREGVSIALRSHPCAAPAGGAAMPARQAPPTMKKTPRSLFALLVLAPLVLANDRAADKVSYQPKTGDTLTKQVVVENELELEDMTMEMDGQDMSEMAGQIEMAMKTSMKLSVTDQYEAMADGRPGKLKRSFEEISSNTHVSGSNPMAGNEEKDIPLSSELEGTTVVFTWDEEDSAYAVAFDGDQKGEEELLEDLEENLDLRGFLPSGEVAEGDTWEIPADAVKAALAPGGDIKLRPESGGDSMGGMDQFSQNDMIGDLEGSFGATYSGTREDEGVRVAVIKLKLDAKSAQDMTDRMDDLKEQMKGQMPEGLDVEISSFDGEFEYEAEGELLWNVEAGVVHGLHLSGEVRMIIDMSMNMTMGSQGSRSMDMSQTFAGNQTLTLTTGK